MGFNRSRKVDIRAIGEAEDLYNFVNRLKSLFPRIIVQGPFRNKYDPGYRIYTTVELEPSEKTKGNFDYVPRKGRGKKF